MNCVEEFNVLIIGSGPAGLFSALTLERMGVEGIAVFDRRRYPAGGLLNDGKLNFDYRIGIDVKELQLERGEVTDLIGKVKETFIAFPRCRQVTFLDGNEKITAIERTAREHEVKFIAPEQWHWGTDNGKALVGYLRSLLTGTRFILGAEVLSIKKKGGHFYFVCREKGVLKKYRGRAVIAAPGRSGAYWFRDAARKLGIDVRFGPIDVGIRVELGRKFYDAVTDVVYDPKFIFCTTRHRDRVRTFCTNPGGRVRTENYGEFKLMNGDALSSERTKNTNFALINTVALTKPFSDTTEFGQMIARQFHLLGGGKPIVQRVGDFREGRRSSTGTFDSPTLHYDVCRATCAAVPGDITLGLPARIVDNLWESLKTLDKIVPGILHPSTLLYAPEIKFFDTQYPSDRFLETNVEGIFVAGDGAGKSRGIVGAAVSGMIAAQGIVRKGFTGKRKKTPGGTKTAGKS